MNTLMMTLQQPLTMATLAHCLGLAPTPKTSSLRAAQRRRQRQRSRCAALSSCTENLAPQGDEQDDDDRAKGCGWFDSSRDLHQGLVVLEHSGAEGLGAELPITVWLSLVLDGAAGAAAAAPAPGLSVRA